jgi:RNA polymerase sigma-70 factor (ECF subfamily)
MEKEARARLEQAQAGDADAFAALFEEMRPVVYAVAYRLVGPDDADDVVMDTYLKAWRAVPRFNHRASLKTWLYRITHNCATDHLRARSRRHDRVLAVDETDDRTLDDFADERALTPDQAIGSRESAQLVQAALTEIGDPYRATLLLRFADGLSYSDIAAATDVSIGTVMSRIFYGKRKLKKKLADIDA